LENIKIYGHVKVGISDTRKLKIRRGGFSSLRLSPPSCFLHLVTSSSNCLLFCIFLAFRCCVLYPCKQPKSPLQTVCSTVSIVSALRQMTDCLRMSRLSLIIFCVIFCLHKETLVTTFSLKQATTYSCRSVQLH
jgi:hypothetical protein